MTQKSFHDVLGDNMHNKQSIIMGCEDCKHFHMTITIEAMETFATNITQKFDSVCAIGCPDPVGKSCYKQRSDE